MGFCVGGRGGSHSAIMLCNTVRFAFFVFRFARVQSHQNRFFFFFPRYPHDIPPGTAVPQWAFYNVTTLPDQTYSDTVAMSVGRKSFSSPSSPLVVFLDAGDVG